MENQNNPKKVPLYNSRIFNTYIKLIKKRYSHVNIMELLESANMKSYEVADEGHWFTQEQVNLFHKKLSQQTNNENIAREAGRFSASPEVIGSMRKYVLGMVSPAKAYELVGNTARKYTKATKFESIKLNDNKVEIRITPREGVKEKPFQCENRIGFFEAMTMGFTNKLPKIDHPECVFRGGKICRYQITWEKTFSDVWKRVRNFAFLFFSIIIVASIFIDPLFTLSAILPIFVFLAFFLTSISDRTEKREMLKSLNHLRDLSDQMIENIEINYNNSLMTNEIGLAISKYTRKEDILTNIIKISENRLDYDRGIILLANADKTKLQFKAGFGYSPEQYKIIKNAAFHLNKPESKGVFVVSFHEKKPFLINDIDEIEETLSPRSLSFAKMLGTKSFVCCPIICDNESLGVLAVDNLTSKRPLIQSDISLIIGIASVLGIGIRNAELLEAKERQFRSILATLAASIDARDPLTAGHSERVTEFSLGICDELNLGKDYRDMIQVAALLHDYGKIGVPDSLLKKPRKLTPEEFEVIKTHSEKTKSILNQVHFEGVFRQVPDIAGAHHEKIDGSGYPSGLSGDKIPLGAKIIAVADFFEAITAKRHYRNPMPIEKATRLLQEESGLHFEKEIVDAFFRYFNKSNSRSKSLPLASSL
ncbi:MAG: HD domain-containing protein [Deltaproteobacteria bacterium]|jgi:HD-GYP domain-containing protein (c-di-GMP phosphodiesterase class II)|nr:HD domain-containing protein [Deltaproteobacteria bacterium]